MPPEESRLPLSFHMTFLPERHYLAALIEFVRRGADASLAEISKATGIPTGTSTGKVKPLIDYARGMGLLSISASRRGRMGLSLTELGTVIQREDRHLLEESTQWLLHLMLCRRSGGAEAWYAVFVEAARLLGRSFGESDLASFLGNRYGTARDALGPLIRTYSDTAALGRTGAVQQRDDQFSLRKVPLQPATQDAAAAALFLAWDDLSSQDIQMAFGTLESASGLMTASGWTQEEQSSFLESLEIGGRIRVDRQTGAPILTRVASTQAVLGALYDRVL